MQNSRMIKKYTDQDFIPKINSLTKISQDKNKSANRRNEIIMHKLIMTTTKKSSNPTSISRKTDFRYYN